MSKAVLDIPDTVAPPDEGENWQANFAIKARLLQKDIYAFESELRLLEKASPSVNTVVSQSMQVMRSIGLTVDNSIEAEHHLKAAIRAAWIESPVCELAEVSPNGATAARKQTRYFFDGQNVDEMHPGMVRWYGRQINVAYARAVEIPDPN